MAHAEESLKIAVGVRTKSLANLSRRSDEDLSKPNCSGCACATCLCYTIVECQNVFTFKVYVFILSFLSFLRVVGFECQKVWRVVLECPNFFA